MYSSFVIGFDTSCTIGGWCHGGMNMCGSGVGHPKGPTSGLKGGFPRRSPLGEFPGCPPFGDWWSKPLGMWMDKLIVICIVVKTNVITSCWISCLLLLVTSWTTIGNWFPTEYGIYVGGTIGYLGIGYTFPCIELV